MWTARKTNRWRRSRSTPSRCGRSRARLERRRALVHYSTDFVFDGTADRPYTEEDQPNPRSTYACSKLVGEWFARDAGRHYVLRVESVFGSPGPVATRGGPASTGSGTRSSTVARRGCSWTARCRRAPAGRGLGNSRRCSSGSRPPGSTTASTPAPAPGRSWRARPPGNSAVEPRLALVRDGGRRTQGRTATLQRALVNPQARRRRHHDAPLAGCARAVPAEPGGSTGPSLTTVRPPSTAASVLLPRSRRFRPGTVRAGASIG